MTLPPDDAFFDFMRAALAGEPVAHDASGRPTLTVVPLPGWQNTITPARMQRLAQPIVRRGPDGEDKGTF